MIRFTEPLSGYSIDVPSYQWGYDDGVEHIERRFGETNAGVLWRERVPDVSRRTLTVTFTGDRALAEQLRNLTYYALRSGGRVQFFPDTATLGTFRWLDWALTLPNTHVLDLRHSLRLTLVEQAA